MNGQYSKMGLCPLEFKSLDDLNEQANAKLPEKMDFKKRIEFLDKMYDQAKQYKDNGNQERAYILFMKMLNLVKTLKNTKEYIEDKKYCTLMMNNSKYSNAICQAEQLQNELIIRYKERDGISEDNFKSKSPVTDSSQYFISCKELFNEIDNLIKKSNNDSFKILILDIRKSSDFSKSHIQFKNSSLLKNNFSLINIPEEKILPGLTPPDIEDFLNISDLINFKKRNLANKVILIDYCSSDLNNNENLKIIYKALTKYDASTERLKKNPLILLGGFENWVIFYPSYCTDVSYIITNNNHSNSFYNSTTSKSKINNSTVISTTFYNYDSLLDNKNNEINEEDEQRSVKYRPKVDELRNSYEKMCSRSKNNTGNVPGSAVYISNSLFKNNDGQSDINKVDRSTKPLIDSKNFARDTEIAKLIKEKEAEEEIRKFLEEEDEKKSLKLSQNNDEIKRMRNENLELKRNLKPSNLNNLNASNNVRQIKSNIKNGESNIIYHKIKIENNGDLPNENIFLMNSMHNDSSEKNLPPEDYLSLKKSETDFLRDNEQTISENQTDYSVPSFPSTVRGFSRSYSSPNIAEPVEENDHYDNFDTLLSDSLSNKPIFDRSAKPSHLTIGLHSGPSSSAALSRNIAPVYGSVCQPTGLRNLGNTCFMNAVIQCLFNIKEFSNYFCSQQHLKDINRTSKFGTKGQLTEVFGVLMESMNNPSYKHISPIDFRKEVGLHIPVYNGCDQQDSHEFLLILLEKLHADLNLAVYDPNIKHPELPDNLPTQTAIKKFWANHIERNQSKVSDLFEGLIMSSLECKSCSKTSNTFEVFSCLSLPIPRNGPSNRCTIQDCLKLFTESEVMSGEAAWYCPNCKAKREAVKKTSIVQLPKVLLIHLKRFSFEGMWKQKIRTFVDFPLENLSLRYFTHNQYDLPTYDLVGIVNHFGTLEGGHYTANCKSEYRNGVFKWDKYDDQEVNEISLPEVVTQEAYILFYVSKK